MSISTGREILRQQIEGRSEQIFTNGVVEEARKLGELYGWDSEAMTGNIYRIARHYLNGELTFEEAKQQFITKDWQLAKRQLTWLRRNPHIQWLSLAEAEQYIGKQLFDYEQKCATV